MWKDAARGAKKHLADYGIGYGIAVFLAIAAATSGFRTGGEGLDLFSPVSASAGALLSLLRDDTVEKRTHDVKTLAALRRSCDAFDGGRLEIVRAEGDILHYRRVGVVQTAEIILNRGPHLIAEEAFGKNTEVNPGGFTVLVEDNHPEHVGYFSVY